MRTGSTQAMGLLVALSVASCVEQHPQWLGGGDTDGGGSTTEGTDSGSTGGSTDTTGGSTTTGSGSSSNSSTTSGSGGSTSGTTAGSSGGATTGPGTGTDTDGGGDVCEMCPWWDPAWGHRSYLDADGSGIGTDTPGVATLVVLNPTRFAYAEAAGDGADLRFVSDMGTILPHHIERWTPGGTSLVWIRTDLAGGTTTRVWLYYGNPTASDASDPAAVWAGYGAVWHLDDLTDATTNGHDGSSAGDQPEEGPLGGARSFDGLGAHVQVGNQPALQYADDLTMSAWFRVETIDNDNYSNVLFAMGAMGEMQADNLLYGINLDPTGTIWAYWESSGAYDMDLESTAAGGWDDGEWHQVVVTRTAASTTVTFYFDGETLGSPLQYGWPPTGGGGGELMIGADPVNPATWNLHGAVDEVRLAPAVHEPTRIQLQYRAESDTLWTYGGPQPKP